MFDIENDVAAVRIDLNCLQAGQTRPEAGAVATLQSSRSDYKSHSSRMKSMNRLNKVARRCWPPSSPPKKTEPSRTPLLHSARHKSNNKDLGSLAHAFDRPLLHYTAAVECSQLDCSRNMMRSLWCTNCQRYWTNKWR